MQAVTHGSSLPAVDERLDFFPQALGGGCDKHGRLLVLISVVKNRSCR